MKEIASRENPAQEVTDSETRGQIVMEGEQGGALFRAGGLLLNQGSHLLANIDGHLAFADSAPGRLAIGYLIGRTVRNTYLRFTYDPVEALEYEEELEELREIEEANRESAV